MTRFRSYLLLILAFAAALQGCRNESAPLAAVRKDLPSISIDGYTVPVFPTPEEQLNYTLSWFESQREKKATLEAVARIFPQALKQKASAALELAYLQLGPDYRQASPEACREAIGSYNRILDEYRDMPEICAKAAWYIGWIYCDLLKENEKGLDMFRIVVADYPDARLNQTPAVPWVTFIDSPREESAAGAFANPFWADLARVEIVRYGRDQETVHTAFIGLWDAGRNRRAVGIALKILLKRPEFFKETVPFANSFLSRETDSLPAKDIRSELEAGNKTTTEP